MNRAALALPVFEYSRHDRAAALYARRTWPNRITEPSRLFIANGPHVYVFGVDSGSTAAAELIEELTRHYNAGRPDEPPCRFVPINRRYWTLERLGQDSPEATARLWRLMIATGPEADAERGRIIAAWQRRELDHNSHDQGDA